MKVLLAYMVADSFVTAVLKFAPCGSMTTIQIISTINCWRYSNGIPRFVKLSSRMIWVLQTPIWMIQTRTSIATALHMVDWTIETSGLSLMWLVTTTDSTGARVSTSRELSCAHQFDGKKTIVQSSSILTSQRNVKQSISQQKVVQTCGDSWMKHSLPRKSLPMACSIILVLASL